MKSIITLLVLISLLTSQLLSAQTKENYLLKSKHQKTAALIMIIGGTVTATAGIISAAASSVGAAFRVPGADRVNTAASVLAITGAAAIIGSIPMFIAANKNKKKAVSLSISGQPAAWIVKNNLEHKTVPSLTLKIGL